MPTLSLINTPSRRPIIQLRINGRDYRFLIDTGATHTFLDPVLLPILSTKQESTRGTKTVYGIDSSVHFEKIAVCFRFAGVQVEELMFHRSVSSDTDDTSGIIGQDILQQFRSVTFDNVHHTVRFEV